MKANTVTQTNKRNFPKNPLGTIVEFTFIPKKWYYDDKLYFNFQKYPQHHQSAGFLDVVLAGINPLTQKHGDIYKDGDVYRKDAVAKSSEEIQSHITANAESEQQQLIQQTLANQVVEQSQTLNDENALGNQAIFPIWAVPFNYTIGFKCQHFNVNNELVLYRCVQAHTSQEDWKPKDVPALFVRVAMPDEILPWVQPTGAHDSYAFGDKVTHNGQTWISIHNGANSWEPGVFGWEVIN